MYTEFSRVRFCVGVLFLLAAPLRAASPVFALVNELDRVSVQTLWPGFDARKTPLELYDGVDTYLFRHPTPPSEFAPAPGHPGFLVYPGKHSTMRANTAITLAGHITATFSFTRADTDNAAILIHECFHVFQALEHPAWTANEAVLFTYPTEDAEALSLGRLEMDALSRALNAQRPECWAARVRLLRRERFARIGADAGAYERGTELHEGLAQYVESVAAGREEVRFRSFGADQVRDRAYVAGEALARLFDRLKPLDWKSKITGSLDELLPESDVAACGFTAEEVRAAEAQARADIDKLKRDRAALVQAFDAQPGWRLTIEAANGQPLKLDSFDPMNVTRLSPQLILHKRWLKLHNDSGSLEILNHGSITVAAGEHPLFDGVRRWTAAGLPEPPQVKRDGARVTISSPMLNIAFSNAEFESQGESTTIHLR